MGFTHPTAYSRFMIGNGSQRDLREAPFRQSLTPGAGARPANGPDEWRRSDVGPRL